MTVPVVWMVESRFQNRLWLPRWFPGNVHAKTLLATMTQEEAEETVRFALQNGAFAALATNEAGVYITGGGVRIEAPDG